MVAAITPKQKKVLAFIEQYEAENGFPPSQKEIARHFNFKSLGTVQNYLVRLERNGFLKKVWNAKRSIQTISPQPTLPYASGTVPLPLLGKVAAGRPIEAVETPDTLEVPSSMIKRGEHFVLKVQGDSMIEDGILDGDYVVVQKRLTANNGETVVALIHNEATIKRFVRRTSGRVELHPANPAYAPIVLESLVTGEDAQPEDFTIAGVMVGLIRQF